MALCPPRRSLGGLLRGRATIRVAVAENSTAEDALKAILHAELLQVLLQRREGSGAGAPAPSTASAAAAAAAFPEPAECEALVREAAEEAAAAFPAALREWQEGGWNTTVALWAPRFVCDWRVALAAHAPPPVL